MSAPHGPSPGPDGGLAQAVAHAGGSVPEPPAGLLELVLERGVGAARPGTARPPLAEFLAERDVARSLVLWARIVGIELPGLRASALLYQLERAVALIDLALSRQVDAILHHPRFQRLEASWRGLRYLVDQAADAAGQDSPPVKIRVLDLSWKELSRDIERAAEFDQTQLFRKVYEAEFGSAGGEPFGLLLGDYEVTHRPLPDHPSDDVGVLEGVSHVAAAAFAPFVTGAHPALLGLDGFRELELPLSLSKTFEQAEYTRWNSLRRSDDARFLGCTAPRVLMRVPYGDDGTRRDGFRYREHVSEADAGSYLWGTAVYAFGAVVVRSFLEYGWPAAVRGVPEDRRAGGIVRGLPGASFETDVAGLVPRGTTDVVVTERLEQELNDLGLIPLAAAKDSWEPVFFSDPSLQQVAKYSTAAARENARLSSMIHCMLSVSRFAHHLKMIGREKVGSFATPDDCQRVLSGWLNRYTLGTERSSAAARSERPLAEARAEVRESPGRPGCYSCVVHLRPHFQVEQLMTTVKLVTEFAPAQVR